MNEHVNHRNSIVRTDSVAEFAHDKAFATIRLLYASRSPVITQSVLTHTGRRAWTLINKDRRINYLNLHQKIILPAPMTGRDIPRPFAKRWAGSLARAAARIGD